MSDWQWLLPVRAGEGEPKAGRVRKRAVRQGRSTEEGPEQCICTGNGKAAAEGLEERTLAKRNPNERNRYQTQCWFMPVS